MIVRHMELLAGTKTVKSLELNPAHAFSWVKGGLWAKVKKWDATNTSKHLKGHLAPHVGHVTSLGQRSFVNFFNY